MFVDEQDTPASRLRTSSMMQQLAAPGPQRRRTAALHDAAARHQRPNLAKLGKPRRGDIFVATANKMNSSSVGAKYAAPTGLGILVGRNFYKDAAPDGAAGSHDSTATRLQHSARGCEERATLGQRAGIHEL